MEDQILRAGAGYIRCAAERSGSQSEPDPRRAVQRADPHRAIEFHRHLDPAPRRIPAFRPGLGVEAHFQDPRGRGGEGVVVGGERRAGQEVVARRHAVRRRCLGKHTIEDRFDVWLGEGNVPRSECNDYKQDARYARGKLRSAPAAPVASCAAPRRRRRKCPGRVGNGRARRAQTAPTRGADHMTHLGSIEYCPRSFSTCRVKSLTRK